MWICCMCHKPRPHILFSMESNFASTSWRPNRWDLHRINSLIWLLPSSNFTTSNFLGVLLLLSWLGDLPVSSFGFCFSSPCLFFSFFFWVQERLFFPLNAMHFAPCALTPRISAHLVFIFWNIPHFVFLEILLRFYLQLAKFVVLGKRNKLERYMACNCSRQRITDLFSTITRETQFLGIHDTFRRQEHVCLV